MCVISTSSVPVQFKVVAYAKQWTPSKCSFTLGKGDRLHTFDIEVIGFVHGNGRDFYPKPAYIQEVQRQIPEDAYLVCEVNLGLCFIGKTRPFHEVYTSPENVNDDTPEDLDNIFKQSIRIDCADDFIRNNTILENYEFPYTRRYFCFRNPSLLDVELVNGLRAHLKDLYQTHIKHNTLDQCPKHVALLCGFFHQKHVVTIFNLYRERALERQRKSEAACCTVM